MARHQAVRVDTPNESPRTDIRKLQMENFFDRCGLVKRWLCRELGIESSTFHYFLDNGFHPNMAERIQELIQQNGQILSRFRFSSDHKADIDRLRQEHGLQKLWLASKLQMDHARLHAATLRDRGLRQHEIETLLESIHASGREQQNFRFPDTLIKRAA